MRVPIGSYIQARVRVAPGSDRPISEQDEASTLFIGSGTIIRAGEFLPDLLTIEWIDAIGNRYGVELSIPVPAVPKDQA